MLSSVQDGALASQLASALQGPGKGLECALFTMFTPLLHKVLCCVQSSEAPKQLPHIAFPLRSPAQLVGSLLSEICVRLVQVHSVMSAAMVP